MNAPAEASQDLLYAAEDGIARLTFNRPQARNALTFAMYERMAAICEAINADRSIKTLIISGAGGKAFASGTDISQFRSFKAPQDALEYEARLDRVLGTLEGCRRWKGAACLRLRLSPVPAPAAERALRRVATCGSVPVRRGSVFPSPARSATACRCRASAG